MVVRINSTRSLPAVCVACHGSHAALKSMANRTIPEDQVFPFGRRPELLCLRQGDVTPVNHALLQRKIVRCLLVGGQIHSSPRIGLETYGPNLQAVLTSRQLFDLVATMSVGEHDHRDARLGVLGLDEGARKRRPVRALHRSSNRRPVTGGVAQQQ